MFALRERRVHVTQEDFEMAVAKVMKKENEKNMSQESFLSQSTNSFEDEPWVATYKKRNVIRKVFDREVWVTEPALRQIQDTIFLQAVLGAFVLSCVFVGIFCAVPRGRLY